LDAFAPEDGYRGGTAKSRPVDHPGTTTDYGLSKLFYDLQQAPLAAEYRRDPQAVMDRYELDDDVRRALRDDDVAALAPRVNAYLLRYYFGIRGMPDATFISKVREAGTRG